MDPFGISLGLGAASAVTSWFNAQEQARQQRRQTAEQVRRLELGQAQQLGAGVAAGAASGIENDSASLQKHLAAMTSEFSRQADWMRRSGAAAASATETASAFGLVTDLGGSFFKFAEGNNWFKTPALETTTPPTYTPGQAMPLWKP